MKHKDKKIEDMPEEVKMLILLSMARSPIGMSRYRDIKKKYPEYWNSAREFDPFFEHRNRFINIFKRVKMEIEYRWWRIGRRLGFYKIKCKGGLIDTSRSSSTSSKTD